MYCPKCSQQQISDETSFCSRCGLPMTDVKALLATDGISPTSEDERQKPCQSPRRKGVRQGVLLIFLCLILTPLASVNYQLNFLPAMVLMAGLMRILYAWIFQAGAPNKKKQSTLSSDSSALAKDLNARARVTSLPSAQSIPIPNVQRRVNTAEMTQPTSVTEHTTKLLNDHQDL